MKLNKKNCWKLSFNLNEIYKFELDARFKIFNWKEKEIARLPNTYGARLYTERKRVL